MESYYTKKFPDVYNKITSVINDKFYPYTTIPNIDWGIYEPEYGVRHSKYTKIVNMTPDDYISKAYSGFKGRAKLIDGGDLKFESMINHRLGDDSYKVIKNKILNNEKLWMPSLSYDGKDFSQEGLHRALASKELGIKNIPVAINGSNLKDVLRKAARFGKILYSLPLNELGVGADYLKPLDIIRSTRGNKKQKIQQMFNDVGYELEIQPDGTYLFKM